VEAASQAGWALTQFGGQDRINTVVSSTHNLQALTIPKLNIGVLQRASKISHRLALTSPQRVIYWRILAWRRTQLIIGSKPKPSEDIHLTIITMIQYCAVPSSQFKHGAPAATRLLLAPPVSIYIMTPQTSYSLHIVRCSHGLCTNVTKSMKLDPGEYDT